MDTLINDQGFLTDFEYPAQFEAIFDRGLLDLEPWHILRGQALRAIVEYMRREYGDVELVPFAARQDNDDVACWLGDGTHKVAVVHIGASRDWLFRERYPDFLAWFQSAINDMVEWVRLEAD